MIGIISVTSQKPLAESSKVLTSTTWVYLVLPLGPFTPTWNPWDSRCTTNGFEIFATVKVVFQNCKEMYAKNCSLGITLNEVFPRYFILLKVLQDIQPCLLK